MLPGLLGHALQGGADSECITYSGQPGSHTLISSSKHASPWQADVLVSNIISLRLGFGLLSNGDSNCCHPGHVIKVRPAFDPGICTAPRCCWRGRTWFPASQIGEEADIQCLSDGASGVVWGPVGYWRRKNLLDISMRTRVSAKVSPRKQRCPGHGVCVTQQPQAPRVRGA